MVGRGEILAFFIFLDNPENIHDIAGMTEPFVPLDTSKMTADEHLDTGWVGYHEVLDRSSLILELIEKRLVDHPVMVENPYLKTQARMAASLMAEFYQLAGAFSSNPKWDPKRNPHPVILALRIKAPVDNQTKELLDKAALEIELLEKQVELLKRQAT